MPTKHIGQYDVYKTAEELTSDGLQPTIERVRNVLGSGSNSTIAKYLKEWKERQTHSLKTEQDLGKEMVATIQRFAVELLEQANDRAESVFKQDRIKHTEVITDLETQLTQAQSQIDALQQQLHDMKKLKKQETSGRQKLETLAHEQAKTIAELEKDLAVSRSDCQLLELSSTKASDAKNEAYALLEAANKSRDDAVVELRHYREKQEKRLEGLFQRLADLGNRETQLSLERDAALTDRERVQSDYETLNKTVNTLRNELKQEQKERRLSEQTSAKLSSKNDVLETKLISMTAQLKQSEARIKTLEKSSAKRPAKRKPE